MPMRLKMGRSRRHTTARPRIQRTPFRDSSTVEQAAVNRKVQGSNTCPGANSPFCLEKVAGRSLPYWKSVAWGSSKGPELDQFESCFRWSQTALQQSRQQYHPES